MESEACSSTSSSEFEENLENVAAFLLLHEGKRKKWVHEINVRREELGEYHRLVQELNEHPDRYHMYFRMTKDEFNFLHELIKEDIKKQNTQFRRAISTEERLAVCLRFLATGNSFRSMGFSYRLGFSTVREIVIEVCDAIWKNLGPIVMPEPTTDIWMKSAEKFKQIWDFPNCIAAIDGKHINIHHSIVLLALVDADYKFITIDVGAYGRNSDGGIFEKSKIGKKLQRGTFSVPGNVPLKTNGLPQLHIIVGDEAFPLKTYLLRPYSRFHLDENEPNKIYNYRLSRARRVVEDAFGILVARWRVFRRHLEVQPYLVDKIVLASCCLHNMLCSDSLEPDIPTLRSREAALQNLQGIRRNYANDAFRTRETFKEYFNSPIGAVPWQIGMELNLDLVQFPKPVFVTEVRIIPLGARVQADFPGGVRLGATNPSQFQIEFFVNDLGKPGASTFETLGGFEYDQNGCINLECSSDETIRKIPTDGLVLKVYRRMTKKSAFKTLNYIKVI
nr:unnamed protein product [Callosobruchus analis]